MTDGRLPEPCRTAGNLSLITHHAVLTKEYPLRLGSRLQTDSNRDQGGSYEETDGYRCLRARRGHGRMGAEISNAAGPDDRALSARWSDRCRGQGGGRGDAGAAGADGRDRERGRRKRRHWLGARGARRAGRPYVASGHLEYACLHCQAPEAGLRRGGGLRADCLHDGCADVAHGPQESAGEHLQGAGGLAQGQPGQGLFGQRRHRQSAPPAR